MGAYAKKRLQLKGNLSKSDFEKLYKSCKDARLKERYHAMLLGFDYEWKEVAKIIHRSYDIILDWIDSYNTKGIDGLKSKKQKGNSPKLTNEQKEKLKEIVLKNPRDIGYDFSNWNAKNLKKVVKDKFCVELSQESVRRNLRKLKFAWKKPEHRFVLADKAEQEKFTNQLTETINNLKQDEVIIFEDECTAKQHPTLKNTWILKGIRKFVGTFGNHEKKNMFGFVDVLNGDVVSKITDSLKSDEFVDGLNQLKQKYEGKKVKLFADNGPCHTSKKTKKYIEDNKNWLEVVYLPKQSPKLNPVEKLWQYMRNVVTHNYLFSTIGELAQALLNFFSSLTKELILSICGIKN